MKSKRIFSAILVFAVILVLTACNLPTSGALATQDVPSAAANAALVEQAAGTIVAQTLTAGAPTITETPQPPLESFTPTSTATQPLPPTTDIVSLVVPKDTYCRQGAPVAEFKSVAIIKAGQLVEVVGRSPELDSYYVKNPYEENSFCWIFGKGLELSGNVDNLIRTTLQPTATPTRTPAPGFTLTYSSLTACAPIYALKLYIQNTGTTPWQYISISGKDATSGFIINHTSNVFDQYSGCSTVNPQDAIPAGDDSYAMNLNPGEFNYDPTGHQINLTVTLCTLDNAQGYCVSKPISFTP